MSLQHGTEYHYRRGCRCVACRIAHADELAAGRRRKETYRRPCPECGTLMQGGDGLGPNAPQLCASCNGRVQGGQNIIWTRDKIIEAIRAFAEEYGQPPAVTDWSPTEATYMGDHARATRAEERIAAGDWPWFTSVVRRFGTWNAAIEAAGYRGRVSGGGNGNIRPGHRRGWKAPA